ncbi:MAG: translation initiation factor IF-2, partial [Chloroflexota bacterium]
MTSPGPQGAQQKVAAVGDLQPRPPVVTIMGHVDHGKTTLLDAIRRSDVASRERGGITQHIGAYQVELDGRRITFLDTPGHEAFTAMRSRGAQATDIAVLVVAADDGVMPQTVEALDHAKAAGVPIVVAINKVDKPGTDVERVKRQLSELGVLIEEWGGDVVCVPVSAKTQQGIPDLLENLLLVADIAELKANLSQPATGVVVEAGLDKARGTTATFLVQNGTLNAADYVVVGDTWGRLKAMFNERGHKLKQAGPATPVVVLGLNGVPRAGDVFQTVATEKEARARIEGRLRERDLLKMEMGPATLRSLAAGIDQGKVKEVNIVLKTDVQGSIDPIKDSLEGLGDGKIKVKVIHAASGSITEGDVLLALASKGIIVGFNTRLEPGAKRMAEAEGVEIRLYDIIYQMVETVSNALKGMVEPTYADVVEGHGRVIATFSAGVGLKKVAGVSVTDGRVSVGAQARVFRGDEKIAESTVKSLRRFQDNVTEVKTGLEAGLGLEGFKDFQVGDVLEFYRRERVE